jgi:hypothetical protein
MGRKVLDSKKWDGLGSYRTVYQRIRNRAIKRLIELYKTEFDEIHQEEKLAAGVRPIRRKSNG